MNYPTELTGQEFGGIYIHEPGALLSNIAIATTCFIIATASRNVKTRAARFWVLFVICIGVGATGGIISHGFPTYLTPEQYFAVWWVKNDFILLANLFAGMAVFSLTDLPRRKLTVFLVFKLLVAAILLFILFDFLPAVIDLAITYIGIIAIASSRTNMPGARELKHSFIIALVSGVFYLFPFSLLNGWFTNKDAVHVFAIVSLLLVSKAVRAMERSQ